MTVVAILQQRPTSLHSLASGVPVTYNVHCGWCHRDIIYMYNISFICTYYIEIYTCIYLYGWCKLLLIIIQLPLHNPKSAYLLTGKEHGHCLRSALCWWQLPVNRSSNVLCLPQERNYFFFNSQITFKLEFT